ncbi:MAG TPA: radical SAM protein [Streptosporangiaceae bacterium]|nr:radical SAM protein [Streptosporangiaceae bacterium]
MSIILVNPPSLYHMPKFGLSGKLAYFELSRRQVGQNGFWSLPGEHLGLRSLQASCAKRGIPVDVVNGQVLFHRSVSETWDAIRASARKNGVPILIGFSGPCQVFSENLQLAGLAKKTWPGCVTVLGHDFATLNHQRILATHPEFDVICAGEGERSFPELALAVLEERDPAGIPGVITRNSGLIPGTPLDLDQLPWPARGDLAPVLAAGLSAAIFTSRGCPYRCTFCTTGETASRLPGPGRHRLKSLDNVLAEIEALAAQGVKHITITDDLFLTRAPASLERAAEFGRRLISAQHGISLMLDCRVDSIDGDVFRLLRQAGLARVFVGVETVNPQQLNIYNKRYTPSSERRAYIARQLIVLRDLGIDVVPGIITYHAEMMPSELWDALDLIDACDIESAFFFLNRLITYPGTAVYRRYAERGLLTADWPVPRWEFSNPLIAHIERTILDAEKGGRSFAELRALFISLLREIAPERVDGKTCALADS